MSVAVIDYIAQKEVVVCGSAVWRNIGVSMCSSCCSVISNNIFKSMKRNKQTKQQTTNQTTNPLCFRAFFSFKALFYFLSKWTLLIQQDLRYFIFGFFWKTVTNLCMLSSPSNMFILEKPVLIIYRYLLQKMQNYR